MEIIVGLGNPEIQYEISRHNIGFLIIDELADRHKIVLDKKGYYSEYGRGEIAGEDVVLAKPLTYMNLSGKAVSLLVNDCEASLEDLLVIHDDIDIPLGSIRKKTKGGDAGHRGVRSVIHYLQSGDFKRLRIGVGRPEGEEGVSDYILKPISDEEMTIYNEMIKKAAFEIESVLKIKKRTGREKV